MTRSRLRPLFALVVVIGAFLVARLFQVQVLEHEVWAREAARLVRVGREIPYRRGRILDAGGRVLARDEGLRSVALVYRDFRRDHPLGQVAHALSLLEGRPVPLPEVAGNLGERARALVALGPRDLRALARGSIEPARKPALDSRQRSRRAADLQFYLRGLLGLGGRASAATWRSVRELARSESETRSFLELAAAVRHGASTDGIATDGIAREEAALAERTRQSLARLETLARWIRPPGSGDNGAGDDGAGDPGSGDDGSGNIDPLAGLLAEIESVRRSVEDATAAKLFAEATGFVPGRLEASTLLECFDHGWISALLQWDGRRLADWAESVRAGWQEGWRDGECLPALFWSLALDPERAPGPAELLSRTAVVYQPEGALPAALEAGPRPWREVDELAVFAGFDGLFEASVPAAAAELGASALPIQLEDLRVEPDDWHLLPPGDGPDSFRSLLLRGGERRGPAEVETWLGLAARLIELWELRFQATVRRALDETRRSAGRGELGPEGGLVLHGSNRERAAERAEFFLKDFGSRPRPLSTGELTYDVVYLLTRFDRHYPGFQVREEEARARVELAGDDARPAERLVGLVSPPSLPDLLRQRREAGRLRELAGEVDREGEELAELERLIGLVRLPSQVRGLTGVEAFFEPELAGSNGFVEQRGLTDVFGRRGAAIPVRDARDGEDVVLTLDAGLQAAAQRCLHAPEVADDPNFDHAWQREPVGAIVLLTGDGDVLAAASEPDDASVIEGAEGERAVRAERTLTKRRFQPPGSVFKIFVAAWALDRAFERGLDPGRTVTCGPIERGGCGYKDLRCWSSVGHGTVDLRRALERSCNAYFAWLGEQLGTRDFADLCAAFGFGEATGVWSRPPWEEAPLRRSGRIEDLAGLSLPADGAELRESYRSMAANGLGVVESTPMQLARATLALGTGAKRELRLVKSIGGREFPRGEPEPLPLRAQSLELVRAAMRGVADDPHGTAHAALAPELLGFRVAVKTGSADLENRRDEEGRPTVRKHAWVAGWVPAEEPELVFVVFEHDTTATSSHGAVYLARQVLQQPEVLAWLAERGVDVSGVAAR